MNQKQFFYSRKAFRKSAMVFLGIGIIGLLFIYLQFFVPSDKVYPARRVAAVFITLLGFITSIILMLRRSKDGEVALTIGEDGILGKTTAPAKAAGLIPWNDIEDIHIGKGGMHISLHDKQKYLQKMTSFMAKEGFKTAGQNIIISTMEIAESPVEIRNAINKFQPAGK